MTPPPLTWLIAWPDGHILLDLMQLPDLSMTDLETAIAIAKENRIRCTDLRDLTWKLAEVRSYVEKDCKAARAQHDREFRRVPRKAIRQQDPESLQIYRNNQKLAAAVKSAEYRLKQYDKKTRLILEELR